MEFRAIPFAAPPVGELRWQPPVPPTPWTATRDATANGKACPQPAGGGMDRPMSGDCLSLYVWTPALTGARPVMVSIHGGAFVGGDAADDLYDGALLSARENVVVVNLNYRLGALGFSSFRRGDGITPAVGLLDQEAGLRWVQRNIAAFGGDPNRVTVFGESAGAWSICAQLAMPGARGLFQRAIMQSGACSDALYFDRAAALAQSDQLARTLGCSDENPLACLRGKSVDQLVGALPFKRGLILPPGVWWGPVVDGTALPELPLAALRHGRAAKVPVLLGWDEAEGVLHTLGFKEVSDAEVRGFLLSTFGQAATQMAARYARATPKDGLTDIVTDGVFACGARRAATALSAAGAPVYLYEWTRALDDPTPHDLGATHGVELFFLWGNRSLDVGLSAAEQPLSHGMMDLWAHFAATGEPGAIGGVEWPRYHADSDDYLQLDITSRAGVHLKSDICRAWDQVERAD